MKRLTAIVVLTLSLAMGTSATVLAAPILWIGDSDGTLGTVDVADGSVNIIGQMNVIMTDIAFDSGGQLWGISFGDLYKIDASNAATTFVGAHNGGGTGNKNSLVFNSGGTLYAANETLFTLDTTSGASSMVADGNDGIPFNSSGDLAFVGGTLFLSSVGETTASDDLFTIDTGNGDGAIIGEIGFPDVYGLASPDNVALYGLSNTTVITIDTTSGIGTFAVSYGGCACDLGIAYGTAFFTEAGASVPEPATLALLGLSLAGLGMARRRRR